MSDSHAADALPEVGSVLGGKYRIERVLGEGGAGVVFEALHTGLGQRVALKMLHPDANRSPEIVRRFEREARATASLHSDHLVRIYDVDALPSGSPFIVMEYLTGHDLNREIRGRRVLPTTEAVDVLLEACAGIAEAHRNGVIHRDIKPSNLFLCDEGGRRVVKVVDFGISKSLAENEVTMTETSLGTPAYMSPEQVRSAKHVDARTDVWSLGVMLYRLLSGELPFEGSGGPTSVAVAIAIDPPTPIEKHRDDLPPALVAVIYRTLEKSVDLRYSNVAEFARAIAPFGSGKLDGEVQALLASTGSPPGQTSRDSPPSLAGPATPGAVALDPPPRPRRAAFPLLALAFLAAALGSFALVLARSSPPAPAEAVRLSPSAAPVVSESAAPSAAPPPAASSAAPPPSARPSLSASGHSKAHHEPVAPPAPPPPAPPRPPPAGDQNPLHL